MENELLWPRVWQMACRLEELPKPGDFVEYQILDQSIIVVRVDSDHVRAYYNSCRHRGMKLVEGSGSRRNFTCPFHGWCWGLDGKNTFVLRPEAFDDANLDADDLRLASVRCELWGGCAWINLDDNAPPLISCLEPFASRHDEWNIGAPSHGMVEVLRPSRQLEARDRGVHGGLPRTPDPPATHAVVAHCASTFGAPRHRDQPALHADAGVRHGRDDPRERLRIAEGLQHMSLPDDPRQAMAAWRGAVNDAVTTWHRARGCDFPDLNDLDRRRVIDPSASASRTTSSSRSSAARRRTGSAPWVPNRRSSRSGR